jgi:hypothetical protein
MFSRVFVGLVAATLAVATPYKRFNGLKVSITANDVNSIADLKVDATVTNTGTEDIKILKVGLPVT